MNAFATARLRYRPLGPADAAGLLLARRQLPPRPTWASCRATVLAGGA